MKRMMKNVLSLLIVAVMLMQMATVGLAAVSATSTGAITYEFDEETNTYSASVYARGLEETARLVVVEYDKTTGTVVNSKVSETAAKASQGIIRASVEVSDEENTVKAFLWNKDISPYTYASTNQNEFSENDVQLYIDGVKFEDFVGEAMTFGGEYTAKLAVPNGDFEIPDVTYVAKNSAMDVDIKTDYTELKTVVTFEGGERIAKENMVVHDGSSDDKKFKAIRYKYSKPWSKTITINWIVSADGYIINDVLENRTGVNGLNGGSVDVKYDYIMEYNIADDKAFDTISFKANKMTSQFSIIVVEALEKETKGYDAIVNADGSAIQWTTDTGVVAGYDYTLTGDDRINEPWDEARATYGEYTNAASVVITGAEAAGGAQKTFAGGPKGQYRVARKMQESDGYFISGSRISEGSRDPASQKIQYIEVPDNVLGYNYITNSGADKMHDVTVTMTVNQDVKLHFISNTDAQTVSKINADASETPITATSLGDDDYRRYYQNTTTYDALSVAYQIVNNDVDESIFYKTSDKTNYVVTVDGVTYTYPNSTYVVRNFAQGFKIIKEVPYGKYVLPENLEKAGLTPTGTDTEKTVPQKTIGEYVSMWRKIGNVIPYVSAPEVITGHVYNGVNVSYAAALRPIIREFDGASTNKSIFSDRNGFEQQRHTGMIESYPEVFDLEDSVFITTAVKYGDGGEGDRTMYRMYGNLDKIEDYEPYPLYTFDVNKDSEVLVFTNGYSHMYLDDPENGWDAITLNRNTDSIRYVHVSNEVAVDADPSTQINTLYKLYRKVFKKGDTVTMYTPGDTMTVFLPFVKPVNIYYTPDAADIKVDGETIDGFDPATREYTYVISDVTATTLPEVTVTAQDASSTVDITYNKEFENAYARAVITAPDGTQTVYYVRFENAAGVTDLYLCTEGNVIPAQYLGEGATEDVVGTHLPVYGKREFGIDMVVWADRTYVITEINDRSLAGKDVIKSRVAWWNAAANPEHKAFTDNASNGVYFPWVNFKTDRDATVMVFKTTANNETAFTDYGFEKETRNDGYFAIVRNDNAKNTSKVKFTKEVPAGQLVTVPNDNEASNSYTIIIKYADYE